MEFETLALVFGVFIGGFSILGVAGYLAINQLKANAQVKAEIKQELTDKEQTAGLNEVKRELDKKANKP